jgi:1D-myo-inositol-tetrakisphosphate 5-kinase/inositol-polyphosphate multikinase
MIVTDKAYGYALTVDRLPEGFAKFFPIPGQDQTGDRAEPARAVQSEGAEPVVQEGQVPVEAGSSSTAPTSAKQPTISSSSTEAYKHSLVRVLRALHRSISDLYALLDRLEIRFIGASLLIVYEGDPEALETAWKIVDEEGQGRGDGLDEFGPDLSGDDESDSASEEEGDMRGEAITAGDATPVGKISKPGFFSGLIGGFGAEKKDGSTGFGLLDKVPPRRRRANDGAPDHDHERDDTDDDEDNDADEEEDETRPRPFTARIIDFAHTRLVHGEGKDVGFLKGLETVLRLIQGRLDELESSQ